MSNSSLMKTKAAALAQLEAVIEGLQKHFPNGQFLIGNVAYTTATLVQVFQGLITAIKGVNAAQVSAKDAVASMRTEEAKVRPVFKGLKRNLQSTYGTASTTLADFGFEPIKAPTPLTVEEKAAAAAKRKATREARGTEGKKQKLAVTGNVVGITVTPITSSATASVAQQPAPVAGPVVK
jgi:hypothetical protein